MSARGREFLVPFFRGIPQETYSQGNSLANRKRNIIQSSPLSFSWGYDALLAVLPHGIAKPVAFVGFAIFFRWFLKDTIKDAVQEAIEATNKNTSHLEIDSDTIKSGVEDALYSHFIEREYQYRSDYKG